jgi:hypothetical protein
LIALFVALNLPRGGNFLPIRFGYCASRFKRRATRLWQRLGAFRPLRRQKTTASQGFGSYALLFLASLPLSIAALPGQPLSAQASAHCLVAELALASLFAFLAKALCELAGKALLAALLFALRAQAF